MLAWACQNDEHVWDHSYVRLRPGDLTVDTLVRLHEDISRRTDKRRFFVHDEHGDRVRLPASYLLRLALLDAVDVPSARVPGLRPAAERVASGFYNDNTSPEIVSAYLARDGSELSLGRATARENALRFLLVQALAAWANARFGLAATGQNLVLFSSPNPPERLKAFSRLAPAELYRRMLMNPCLSGFENGEAKAEYMHLCHETLSRSRLAVTRHLREAGIGLPRAITRLTCETSLLNNGVHVSLGSACLTEQASGPDGDLREKHSGDLMSKLFEHFLPLFAGTFSAAPARLPFSPLKPEQSLGFLPLELAPAPLRQTWWAWGRKAGLLGTLRGDVVPDARLLDYFAALPSTHTQQGHDGLPGNHERLLAALEAAGVYDRRMSFYDLYKLRRVAAIGFSGFEARFHSLFPGFFDDMAPAVDLQRLVTAALWNELARGGVSHGDCPDDPASQGERRQMLFHAAIGLPFFYVNRTTRNRFLLALLKTMPAVRTSKRYPSCYKVNLADFGVALCDWLRARQAGTVSELGGRPLLQDVVARLQGEFRADRRILQGTDRGAGRGGAEIVRFNRDIERHLRTRLRETQQREGLSEAREALRHLHADPHVGHWVSDILGNSTLGEMLGRAALALGRPAADPDAVQKLIALLVAHAQARHKEHA